MEILVLDENLQTLSILESITSLIWTDRYDGAGDFEIYTLVTNELLDLLRTNRYIWSKESEHLMIIESVEIKTDVETGSYLTVNGRSLESILERRIIWQQTIISGNLQDSVELLLNQNAIVPSDPDRAITKLIFEPSTDPAITALTIETQFTGDNLYDALSSICRAFSIGFKITLSEDNLFVFKLYSGADRSYSQTENSYVVFSPSFENITGSNYFESISSLKTVALVAGEGEGSNRVTSEFSSSEPGTDLNRRELFVDARDLSSVTNEGTLSPADYLAQLDQRGYEYLANYTLIQSFEGEVDSTVLFIFGRDFFMGDLVQIVNDFGQEARSRVTEVIFSQSSSGVSVLPTFSKVI